MAHVANEGRKPTYFEGPVPQCRRSFIGIALSLSVRINEPAQFMFGKERPVIYADLSET
jgi:hypothetical protein